MNLIHSLITLRLWVQATVFSHMLKPPLSDYSPYRTHAYFTQVFFFSAATACHSMMSSSQLVSPPDMEASTSTLELSSSGQPLMREITRIILRTMVLKPRCINTFDDPSNCFVPTILQKSAFFFRTKLFNIWAFPFVSIHYLIWSDSSLRNESLSKAKTRRWGRKREKMTCLLRRKRRKPGRGFLLLQCSI